MRFTKRTSEGIAYMAIADTLLKHEQEVQGSKPILEGLYAMFQKLAEYEDKDNPIKPKEDYNWCDYSEEDRKERSRWFCSKCDWDVHESWNHCAECGQKIDWE